MQVIIKLSTINTQKYKKLKPLRNIYNISLLWILFTKVAIETRDLSSRFKLSFISSISFDLRLSLVEFSK